jgi:DNA polymerase-3 subunit epsilon
MLNQILELTRPLAIFDFETTGLDPETDRIIQIAMTKHYPDKEPISWVTLVDPEVPIRNSEKHGITDEMVQGKPKFQDLAPNFAKHLGIDLGGYNVNFDIRFAKAQFKACGIEWDVQGHIIDPIQIYKAKRGHTLSNAYLEYGGDEGQPLPHGTTLDGAHDAGVDVWATEVVIRGQLLRHKDIPRTVEALSSFCFPKAENSVDRSGKFIWVGNDVVITFGKWKGKKLQEVNRGYLKWLSEADFPDDVKLIAIKALDGEFPKKC